MEDASFSLLSLKCTIPVKLARQRKLINAQSACVCVLGGGTSSACGLGEEARTHSIWFLGGWGGVMGSILVGILGSFP